MSFIDSLTPALENINSLGYWIFFAISFAESIAFAGMMVPGSALIFLLLGVLFNETSVHFTVLVFFGAAGAIFGDGLSFWLGRKGDHLFDDGNRIFKKSHLRRGERFLKKYGVCSIFLARFAGPFRPLLPFVAGLCQMPTRLFVAWCIFSGFAWSIVYVTLGYYFGEAWHLVERWTWRALIFIAIFIFIVAVLRSRKFRKQVGVEP